MKKNILIIILLFTIIGCSQKDIVNFDENSFLIIEERVGDDYSNDYEVINEIDDKESVKKVIDILNNARWKTNVEVDMPREPDYKINNNFLIWVSSKENMLEITFTEDSYFVQLSESQSSKLYKIITGKEL